MAALLMGLLVRAGRGGGRLRCTPGARVFRLAGERGGETGVPARKVPSIDGGKAGKSLCFPDNAVLGILTSEGDE
ncbi:hypothetical protein GCM10022630_21590 [Thermobifida alba]